MLLLFINLVIATQLTFDQPGEYQLTPEMYNFSDEITVELWGAGGGGCSGMCGIGGGSGAYIKAKVATLGQTFNLSVGLGGQGGPSIAVYTENIFGTSVHDNYSYVLSYGENGGDTSFIGNNTNLIAGGGYQGNHSCVISGASIYGMYNGLDVQCRNRGIIKSTSATIIYDSNNGNNGETGSVYCNYPNCNLNYCCCDGLNSVCKNMGAGSYLYGGSGGSSGYGFNGKGNKIIRSDGNSYCSNQQCMVTNGTTPANGGGGSFTIFTWCSMQFARHDGYVIHTQRAGNGGNGTIIVTFDSCPNPSRIQYPSPSVTSTNEDTSSVSPRPSQSSSSYPEYHYWYTFSASHTRVSSTSSQTRSSTNTAPPTSSSKSLQSIETYSTTLTPSYTNTASLTFSSTLFTQSVADTYTISIQNSATSTGSTRHTSNDSVQDNEIIYSLILLISVLIVVIVFLATLVLTCMLRVKNNIYINQTISK